MRLCFVAPASSTHTMRWLQAFVERKHDVHQILLPGEGGILDGVTVHHLPHAAPKVRFALWVLALHRILRQIRPDILHAHYISRYGWLAAASRYHPLVLTAWGTDVYTDPQQSRLIRQATSSALRCADLVTADADDLSRRLVSLGARPDRVRFLQWGVDLERFRPGVGVSRLRQRLGLGREAAVILSTRALTPLYNQDVLLRALPAVLGQVPEARLVIKYNVFDPVYLETLHNMVASLGLQGTVHFVPAAAYSEMVDYYNLAKVFVSIASSDSTPVSLLEAMACGIAPVVGDLPAIREWIADGQNGLCVEPRDEQSVSAAITQLLISPDLRHVFAQANRHIVETRADHAAGMSKMEDLYATLSRSRDTRS